MKPQQPLVNKTCLLHKFPGKGGWTYTEIPEVMPNKHNPFGWVRVRGTIDSYEIKGYHLMPLKNGSLFLPIKASIRKKIGKQEGDYIQVVLYADDLPTELPYELKCCLQDEPDAYATFLTYSDAEQKACIEWIYESKTEDTKVERIAKLLDRLATGKPITNKIKR